MLINTCLWILAIYGFIEILSVIINSTIKSKPLKDMYILIAVKNQENSIEYIVRSIIFKNIYCKNDEIFNNILIADMGSTDRTLSILQNLSKEYSFLKILDGNTSKELIQALVE